ncbi:interleukin-17F-like [Suncus etruscus]|uniref:interleukin-17F-like n=1 Tax=Suncus etruscus TaxID=109475 RepID=UPI002110028C|nr:interleukin-17F-like [Suncus etruscus]
MGVDVGVEEKEEPKNSLHRAGNQNKVTMTMLRETVLIKTLLLLLLGLTVLKMVAARKKTKVGGAALCPTLEDQSVRVNISIIDQSPSVPVFSQNFQNRSISPWDYHVTEDHHRIPSFIAEARCRYQSCLNAEGEEDSSLNSVPIKHEFLVLRREPKGCSHSFHLERVWVTVGCTCVTPIVHHVQGPKARHQLS